ncbi:DMT family transporter [Cognatiyoonia sp.]|uniref:DMT family transporter n=1 Tax=Cognatiyoonia sp. TaxID=2211652 RepID=UPI003F69CC50
MILFITMSFVAGILVSVSRQLNGRLSLSTSAMEASFWNHIVGFVFLSLVALVFGGLFDGNIAETPKWAYLGGTIGVLFIAASSWLVAEIGAVKTTLLIIAGQMIFGLVIDLLRDVPGDTAHRIAGTVLILAGMWLLHGRQKRTPNP